MKNNLRHLNNLHFLFSPQTCLFQLHHFGQHNFVQDHMHNSTRLTKLPFNQSYVQPKLSGPKTYCCISRGEKCKEGNPYTSTLISRQVIPAPQVLLQQHRAAWSMFWAGYSQRTTVIFVVFVVNTSGQWPPLICAFHNIKHDIKT